MSVQPFWQQVVIGFILIAAVYLDQLKRRSRDRADRPVDGGHPRPMKRRSRWISARSRRRRGRAVAACGVRRRQSQLEPSSVVAAAAGSGRARSRQDRLHSRSDRQPVLQHGRLRRSAEAKELGVDFPTRARPSSTSPSRRRSSSGDRRPSPDAIMISVTDPKAMIAPLKAAKDAGIKIIDIDGDLADTASLITNIQSDNLERRRAGRRARWPRRSAARAPCSPIDNATGFPIVRGAHRGLHSRRREVPEHQVPRHAVHEQRRRPRRRTIVVHDRGANPTWSACSRWRPTTPRAR